MSTFLYCHSTEKLQTTKKNIVASEVIVVRTRTPSANGRPLVDMRKIAS